VYPELPTLLNERLPPVRVFVVAIVVHADIRKGWQFLQYEGIAWYFKFLIQPLAHDLEDVIICIQSITLMAASVTETSVIHMSKPVSFEKQFAFEFELQRVQTDSRNESRYFVERASPAPPVLFMNTARKIRYKCFVIPLLRYL
jgi:hypothetical protein